MDLRLTDKTVVVFDLDDTLYPERDYVRSGYDAVARAIRASFGFETAEFLYMAFLSGCTDVLEDAIRKYGLPPEIKQSLLQIYRFHFPTLCLSLASEEFLNRLRELDVPMGLITDGRSLTQRLKIAALGIREYFDCICVSEEVGAVKPSCLAYRRIMAHWPNHRHFVYIADNPAKDFLAANALGWTTIGIRHSFCGIHAQDEPADLSARPLEWVCSFSEIVLAKEKI